MSKDCLLVGSSSFRCSLLALCCATGIGCSNDSSGKDSSLSSDSAGHTGTTVSSATGGSHSAGGSVSSGGGGAAGASSTGNGGKGAVGGHTATGGSPSNGGNGVAGSITAAAGRSGGAGAGGTAAGGESRDGSVATGGTRKTGGTTGAGGASGTGGGSIGAMGGSSGGSSSATGADGSTSSTSGGAKASNGCGKAPATLKSATVGQATPVNTVSVGGKSREFLVRWPSNYKNDTPYRLHIGLHGYGGDLSENGKDNFGLWSLSKDTTIFVTLAAVGGAWDFSGDLAYADEVLKQVENELCIDTSRVMLEGFSQGGAMAWVITCSRSDVYRAVVGHSAGSPNFTAPTTCSPVAYLGSLGLSDIEGNSQATQTDRFAKADGCTIENLPTAPSGGHICTPYKGCPAAFPVVWCSYDGGHGFTPTDSGKSATWMPAEVWSFLSPL